MKKTIVLSVLLLISFVPMTSAQVESLTVRVDGLACPFCAYGIEKKLKKVAGVKAVTVDMQGGTVSLAAKQGQSIDFGRVPKAVSDAGFTAGEIRIKVSGFVEETGEGLRLNWDGRVLLLTGLKGDIKKELLSLARSGGTVHVTGAIGEKDGVWSMTPEAIGGEAP